MARTDTRVSSPPLASDVDSAVPLGDQLLALELVEATPDAVGFPYPDGVIETRSANGARGADALGSAFPCLLLILALEVRGREEDCGLWAAACGLVLPEILELLDELRKQRELAVLLITHDLGVVAEVADRVAVMYTGRIVEESPVEELFARPKHPYTEGLLRSVPKLTSATVIQKERLETIEGVVPRPTDLPPGCHFAPRCPHRMPRCTAEEIPLYQLDGSVQVRCVLYDLAAAVAADHEGIHERSS